MFEYIQTNVPILGLTKVRGKKVKVLQFDHVIKDKIMELIRI